MGSPGVLAFNLLAAWIKLPTSAYTTHVPDKTELVRLFRELTELLILDEGGPGTFRVRAYENATEAIAAAREDLSSMSVSALAKMEGIGKSTASRIREYFDTGRIARLEELRSLYPADFVALLRIPGLGPKTLLLLRNELGVSNLDDLKKAIAEKRLRSLKGMGRKTEEKLTAAIERIGSKQDRRPISHALPLAKTVVLELKGLPEVERVQYAGSLRRFRETIADIDIVVASENPAPIMDFFVNMPRVVEVLGHGDTKASVVTDIGIQIDLRVVELYHFGAALLYFTGSKHHNIKLRQRALDRGYTLNEYGLSSLESGEIVASKEEEDIYRALDLPWFEPTMREATGEIEAADAGTLPTLLTVDDLKGDLHLHSDFSGDAQSSVEEMVETAKELGYVYLAITDHGENLAINGVKQSRHAEIAQRVAALRDKYPDMLLLHGCELNIAKDGSLDYDEKQRARFDLCVASVHSHFDLPKTKQTDRIIKAIQDPCVRIWGHPLGRNIGTREPIGIDESAVIEAAIENKVAIEVNAGLSRLDAPAGLIRRGVEAGALFAVNSDAHHKDHLAGIENGVTYSHRGWLPAESVINTWDKARFAAWLAS